MADRNFQRLTVIVLVQVIVNPWSVDVSLISIGLDKHHFNWRQ